MFKRRVLPRPPIREAIFTITFKDPLSADKLNEFINSDFVKEKFPAANPGYIVEIQNESRQDVQVQHRFDGYDLKPADLSHNRLIKIRQTFISYHNLNNYDGWEVMISELKEVWANFCKAVQVEVIGDVRVRNINHILLPLPLENGFKEYLTFLPQVPSGINPKLGNFFLQIHTSEPEGKLRASITESILTATPNASNIVVLLDISVFKRESFPCNKEGMWNAFDELRDYKDDLFFKCITEKTINLFL